MTRQLDIFAANTASATGIESPGTVGSASAGDPRGHEVNQETAPTRPIHLSEIRWPVWPQYKTDYDADRPPFGVAEGWDHMVHVVRQRDALRRKARP